MVRAVMDRVFIRLDTKETATKGGIILTETHENKRNIGVVEGVGPEVRSVKVGEKVLFQIFDELPTYDPDVVVVREKSSPNVVEVTVVAQSIKDMEDTVVRQVNANASDKYRTTSSGNYSPGSVDDDGIATKTDCAIGEFDMYEHKENDDKNVYFDEITGEVKMRATFIFDQLKRRLRIGEVDYL